MLHKLRRRIHRIVFGHWPVYSIARGGLTGDPFSYCQICSLHNEEAKVNIEKKMRERFKKYGDS